MKFYFIYDTKIGRITIFADDDFITGLVFGDENSEGKLLETDLIREAYTQLTEYLDGKRIFFDIPILLKGTDFQKKIWKAINSIPYGSTSSYGATAEKIGSPGASRVVGMACNRNPAPIFIPCHRVIGSNGSLTGYSGGLDVKKALLNIEKGSKKDEL